VRLKNVLATLLILGVATAALAAAPRLTAVRIAGTYSDLRYNDESGDLLGMEVKIVPVAGGRWQAAILVSEGEPAPLVVIDVQANGRTISFQVPGEGGWSFRGTIAAKSLKGVITYGNGTTKSVTLPRGCGYWDR
jgi:hypothetical protein